MVSAVILAKNEEENIKKCLESVSWCESILIDDYSNDNTVKISKKLGAKVFSRNLNNDFAAQRNFGLSKARGEWVLFLDADEIVSMELKEEILRKINQNQFSGFLLRRKDLFLGKELNYGENGNIKILRLAKKGGGLWKRSVHEYWDINGNISELKNPLYHKKGNLHQFIDKINFYSDIHANENYKEGKRPNLFKIIFYPLAKFIVNYFLRLGFLDGTVGFIMAILMSLHSFLAWAKLWTY